MLFYKKYNPRIKMENKSKRKGNIMFLFFTLLLCYPIYFWPEVNKNHEEIYFLSTSLFVLTIFIFHFCYPVFLYYNFWGGNINKGLTNKQSWFFLILAIIVSLYPGFAYYSDLDTLKTHHSKSYCGVELKIGRSTLSLEKFSFNKQCIR